MFQQDYILRMFLALAEAMRRSMERESRDGDPESAARMLEHAISDATEMDGEILLSLAPASLLALMT